MFKLDLSHFKIGKIKLEKNSILVIIAVAAIIITAGLMFADKNSISLAFLKGGMSPQKIAESSIEYINTTILSGGTTASLVSVSEESGVVKMRANIGGTEYDLYATKDGKFLFPEAINMAPKEADNSSNTEAVKKTCESLEKSENPELQAFVVSQCPYGLQMQRVLAKVIEGIPSLASNIKVRYMGTVSNGTLSSMHGEEEAQENMRQICIREEQASKYWKYVSCYMQAGKTDNCLASTGVDTAKLNACVADSGRGLAYAKTDADLTTQYSIKGSPTLIVDGAEVSEFDFGGRTAESVKSIICCSMTDQPQSCSAELDTSSAASSFSTSYTSSSGSNASANCQ